MNILQRLIINPLKDYISFLHLKRQPFLSQNFKQIKEFIIFVDSKTNRDLVNELVTDLSKFDKTTIINIGGDSNFQLDNVEIIMVPIKEYHSTVYDIIKQYSSKDSNKIAAVFLTGDTHSQLRKLILAIKPSIRIATSFITPYPYRNIFIKDIEDIKIKNLFEI